MGPNNSGTRLLLWSALGVAVNAKGSLDGLVSPGASVPANSYNNSTTERATIAQQNPNATRKINIKPFAAVSGTHSELDITDIEWTWRVNISKFAAPDVRDAYKAVDPHLVSISYDFSWSDPVPASLANAWSGLCITASDATDMPANVTNTLTYDGVSDSADCALALGQSCVDAILAAAGTPIATENGTICNTPTTPWSELDECSSTLGYNARANGYSSGSEITWDLGFYTSTNTTTSNGTTPRRARESGSGLYGHFSGAQNGSDVTEYYSAANRIQIMLVNPMLQLDSGVGGKGGSYATGPVLYCMRVNATKLPTKDTDGDSVVYTSEAVLEGAGVSIQDRAVGALPVLFSVMCGMIIVG
ncbi:hypothetical protein LQW54_008117 [Pestalotiopsis sp. IQ-011]